MIRISRLALVAIVAMGIVSPAFAQSPQHRIAVHRSHGHAIVAGDSGFNAFAMVPGGGASGAFSPALNGGGSAGYNEHVRRDQW